jgi:hypothetical protein
MSPRAGPDAKTPAYCGIAIDSADYDFLGMIYKGRIEFAETILITEHGGMNTREVDNRKFDVPHECPWMLDFLMLREASKCQQ